jgi:membrane protease YdiL (CAAX protease family)
VVDGRAPLAPPRAALPPPSTAPAGWYRDPYGYPLQRYFDGRAWTHHTAALVARGSPAHPTLPVQAAVGAIAVLGISLIASRLLLGQIVELGWPVAVYIAINVIVGYGPSVWWCRYASRRWGSGHVRHDLGIEPRWSDLGWGPVVWLAAVITEGTVAAMVTAFDIPLTSNTEGIQELDLDRTYVISLLVTAVVAAPIVEEAVFRGLILRGLLSRFAPVAAIAVQGMVFGAVHVDPLRGGGNLGLAIILASVGIALGVAAYLLRRIGPTMIAHAILNGVVMAYVLTR